MTNKEPYKILYTCRAAQTRALEMERIKQLAEIYNLEIIFTDSETIKRKEQLEKAIEILKEKFEFKIEQRKNSNIWYLDYCIILDNEIDENTAILLKEVVEDDK